ncbi:MAG: YdcF family protein [Lachnospiraceae bacterium]|nr:YdcF family protein [Lachnospiraceae bacterium]
MGKALIGIGSAVIVGCVLLAVIISFRMIRTIQTKPTGDVMLLVLGCQVKGTNPSLMLTERLETAKKYLDEHENAVCILSGGQGEDEGISEAECMYRYLTEHGISKERLIKEARSTSTRENIQYSKDIMQKQKLGNKVAIVTNEFHEYRAFQIAKKQGIEPYAEPARTHWWLFPTYLVREWYGVIYEKLGIA